MSNQHIQEKQAEIVKKAREDGIRLAHSFLPLTDWELEARGKSTQSEIEAMVRDLRTQQADLPTLEKKILTEGDIG